MPNRLQQQDPDRWAQVAVGGKPDAGPGIRRD